MFGYPYPFPVAPLSYPPPPEPAGEPFPSEPPIGAVDDSEPPDAGVGMPGVEGAPPDTTAAPAEGMQEFFEFEPEAFEYEDEDEYEWEEEVNRQSPQYGMWVQQSLNKLLGLRLTVDGILGTQSRSAIRSFQQKAGLTADGLVGAMTEAAMVQAGAAPPPQSSGAPTSYVPGTTPPGGLDIVNVRGIQVARQIAPNITSLLAAADADGVRLSGGGFRSPQKQIELRRKHCGPTDYDIYKKPSSQCTPPTATPGRSNHEKGLAIDFTYNGAGIKTHDNPGFRWLDANASRFGLFNLPSEPWHWSVDGR
ncbi:MAG TPA: peptidoglycan-binding protein [Blastocatellia bacterium]|nr:peptidoglycan-binding protein [Blastocatellia bacterium]